LIAGRTAQEYNQRKTRQGAFWEDRYHATAIETDEHLHRCLVYIDLNMVRASVIDHPAKWKYSGYHEIQQPPKRYAVIDLPGLVALCGFSELADFQQTHCQWIEESLHGDLAVRDARWSEAVAVGSLAFVEKIKGELGVKALHREVEQLDGTYALREPGEAYWTNFDTENESLRLENTLLWERINEVAALSVVRPRAPKPRTALSR
jgi:putative transposase